MSLPTVALVVAVLLAAAAGVAPWDLWLSQAVSDIKLPSELKKLIGWSEVVAHGLGVGLILLILYVVALEIRPKFWWLVACPIAGGLAANLVKISISRLRPYRFFENPDWQDYQAGLSATFVQWLPIFESTYLRESWRQSFPSGHTATAVGFAVGLAWLFPRGRYLFYGMAALAGLQRVVSRSHWPSDVLVAAALGLICGALCCHLGSRSPAPKC